MGAMNKVVQIEELALEALQIDGSHHKQWYLEQILEVCGWDDPKELQRACPHEEGIAP